MKLTLSIAAALLSLNSGITSIAQAAAFSPDIVGGQVVTPNDLIARRTVGLVMLDSEGNGGICTGAILSKTAILTAAHCVYKKSTVVVVFARTNLINIVKQGLQSRQTIGKNYRVARHFRMLPGYTGQAGGMDEFNDLALVTFEGGLPEGYEPAHFLNQAEGTKRLAQGATVTLAGYGITSVEERDQTISGPRTSGTLRKVNIRMAGFSPNKKNIVLGGSPGRDACSGDSGGPAMVTIDGNVYVVGIASRSDCVTMSIYTWVPREKAARAVQIAQNVF